jgi:hypothetical protein
LQKIIIILFLIFYLWSCSVTKKISNTTSSVSKENGNVNIIDNVIDRNITSAGFFIQKVEIEYVNNEGKQKYLANIKFEFPDKYLISIKSRTGIEGARIYINKDSLIVNDRINKKMYFGKSFYFRRKFGFDQSLLPLIFGDIIVAKSFPKEKYKCDDKELKFDCYVSGSGISYNIDCKKGKSTNVVLKNNYLQKNIIINYDSFKEKEGIVMPGIIELEDLQLNTKIRLKYSKIDYPWYGIVKFIPGRGYELKELL